MITFQERDKSLSVRGDKLVIEQILLEQNIKHAIEQRDIGAGSNRQMQIGEIGGFGAPRIDRDNRDIFRVCEFSLFDPFEQHRMTVRGVGADQQQTIGGIDIDVTGRWTIRAERSFDIPPLADDMHSRELVSKLFVPINPLASLLPT